MDPPVTFGEWLRQKRDKLGLTREEFSNRVGCSVAMLRKIESDERRPSRQIAELLANCLDISLAERETFVRVARGELGIQRLYPTTEKAAQSKSQTAPTPCVVSLPILPTPLIGRQHEVDELSRLLSDPQTRMLTLVGTGGIGKTRLAIEVASQMQENFADGIYFVPLASVNASRFIVPVMANSLGFTFRVEDSADPKSQLIDYLNEKVILLLLDNLEHLLSDSMMVDLLAEMMGSAAQVKLLVTSREALQLQGEWVFEVQGLPIPEGGEAEGTSVELFLQRARRANVGFSATTDDYPAIIRICQLVDGMPLGIELAAAWVRTLSCSEIASEIESDLDFLSISAKDLPARHRSMRAVFDQTWKLLPEEERMVVQRLSVFQGGFQRKAAEHIAEASLSTLSSLVTKSLIRRNDMGRYDLHEVIRQFAFEQLSKHPDEKTQTIARHGRYYMALLSNEDERLRSAAQQETLTGLTCEIENIRSALDWALSNNNFVLIEETLRAYMVFYDSLCWTQEALDYLGRARDALETLSRKLPLSSAEQIALAHILTARSLFAFRIGQHEQAHSMLEHSIEMLRPLNETQILVEALTFLGITSIRLGNFIESLDWFREGLQLAKSIGDQWFAALCLTEQVYVNNLMNKSDDALSRSQEVVEAWRTTGDPRFTAFGLQILSVCAVAAQRYEMAQRALEESISLYGSVGDRNGLAGSYRGLAMVAQSQGQHIQALDLFRKSKQFFTELGARWDLARVLSSMGKSTFALGNVSESEKIWDQAIRMAIETKGTMIALDALVGIAELKEKSGMMMAAYTLLWVAMNHPAAIQETKIKAAEEAAKLEMKLTPEEIESAQSFADKNTFESVVQALLHRTGIFEIETI